MPKPPPPPKPNPLRVWLKQAMQSGALERIPGHYPLGGRGGRDTLGYAHDLLAELRDPDTSPRPLDEIVADAVRFRQWVESRQQISRRIILAESRQGEGFDPQPRQPSRDRRLRSGGESPTPRPSPPRSDPMWDEFLDGLEL